MREFENMNNLTNDLFEYLSETFKPMREDEHHEVSLLEAKERLQEEINWLEGRAYHCKVNDYLHDMAQYEAEAQIKREKLSKLCTTKND